MPSVPDMLPITPVRISKQVLRSLLVAAAALAVVASLPAAADAAMLVYRDGNDVWEASPDGAIKRQVTTDGAADAYYSFPSVDDAGTVTAMRNVGGVGAAKYIWVKSRTATTPTVNVMPWRISGGLNSGPTWARVRPQDGTMLVYKYLLNKGVCFPGCGIEDRFAMVNPAAPGSPTMPGIDQPAVSMPTWHGDHLVAGKDGAIAYERSGLVFDRWLADPDMPLQGAEVNRALTRIAVLRADSHIEYVTYEGSVETGGVRTSCQLPVAGISWFSISPDGNQVAYSNDSGLYVTTPTATTADACPVRDTVLLSATGTTPAFSAATLTKPGGDTDPGKTTTTTQTTTTTPTTTVTTPATTTTATTPTTPNPPARVLTLTAKTGKAAALRRSLRVTVGAPGAGALTVTLAAGKRTLGTAKATAKKAGKVTLTLRPTKAGAKRIRTGVKLTLRVRHAPKTGKPVTKTITLKVR